MCNFYNKVTAVWKNSTCCVATKIKCENWIKSSNKETIDWMLCRYALCFHLLVQMKGYIENICTFEDFILHEKHPVLTFLVGTSVSFLFLCFLFDSYFILIRLLLKFKLVLICTTSWHQHSSWVSVRNAKELKQTYFQITKNVRATNFISLHICFS